MTVPGSASFSTEKRVSVVITREIELVSRYVRSPDVVPQFQQRRQLVAENRECVGTYVKHLAYKMTVLVFVVSLFIKHRSFFRKTKKNSCVWGNIAPEQGRGSFPTCTSKRGDWIEPEKFSPQCRVLCEIFNKENCTARPNNWIRQKILGDRVLCSIKKFTGNCFQTYTSSAILC